MVDDMRLLSMLLIALLSLLFGCCGMAPEEQNPYGQRNSQPLVNTSIPAQHGISGQVRINDHSLSNQEMVAFQNFYGTAPQPGNYWYDPVSGLYGREGEAAAGFIYPGHDFGTLSPDASDGDTGIFLNGRELTEAEVQFFEQLLGTKRQQGYFHLDSYGNIGIVGYAPFANIFNGGANSGSGSYYAGGDTYSGLGYDWGGGDNFWSTSYGAGNSQGGCTYVNVGGDFATSGCG